MNILESVIVIRQLIASLRLCSQDAATKKRRLISSPFCIVHTIPVQFKFSAISTGVHTIRNKFATLTIESEYEFGTRM